MIAILHRIRELKHEGGGDVYTHNLHPDYVIDLQRETHGHLYTDTRESKRFDNCALTGNKKR
jgi:hypothetical protein